MLIMSKQSNNLLKDAVAEAKVVRATALANAKAALEEAFNQRFSAVFADKLREDSANESDLNIQTEPVAESADKDKVGSTKPSGDKNDINWGKNGDPAGKPEAKNITPNTVPSAKDGGDATKDWSKDNKGNGMDGTPQGVKENSSEGAVEEESVEETVTNEDLDEIIRELEAEAGSASPDDMGTPDSSMPAPDDASAASPETETPAEDSQEIKSGDTVVISKVENPAPEVPPTEEPGVEDQPPVGGEEVPPTAEEDIDLNELLASLNEEAKEEEEEDEKVDENKKEEKEEEEDKKMDEVLSQLNEAVSQRDEAYKTVQYLKTQINEINLLNAKLLYTNKLFKEYGMNRDQKVKVVEAFDLTKNVREVKMTYANWCESLNFGGKAQRRPQAQSNVTTITEGSASKTVASTKPAKQIITESFDEQARRFQKLAGINVKR